MKIKDALISQGFFVFSSSYYNTKISRWEPVIEKWALFYEIENLTIKDKIKTSNKLTINFTNPYNDLNINVSQEFVRNTFYYIINLNNRYLYSLY